MRFHHNAWAVLLLGLLPFCGAYASETWAIWNDPDSPALLTPRTQSLLHSSHCADGCRYDRDGRGSEGSAVNSSPSRALYEHAGERFLFDQTGPGVLTRIWMTSGLNGLSVCLDPQWIVRFRFDNEASPRLQMPLAALFDGSIAPFLPPLVSDRLGASGAFTSYVPIPYAERLQISITDLTGVDNACTDSLRRLLWFQFNHQRLPLDVKVDSFRPDADLLDAAHWMSARGSDPWQRDLPADELIGVVSAEAPLTLYAATEPGWLRSLQLRMSPESLHVLRLRVVSDGAVRADMPLADFMARSSGPAAPQVLPQRSVLMGEDDDGWFYSWLPMPHRQSMTVSLHVDDSSTDHPIEAQVRAEAGPVAPQAAPFFAVLAGRCSSGDGADLQLLHMRGAGRIVGVAGDHWAAGNANVNYLEADERVAIDGRGTPVWYGTGLEDFFNGGFYFDQGPYSEALSGASAVDPLGTTHMWRWMIGDALSFQHELDWRLESGASPATAIPVCARSVFYGYGQAGSEPAPVEPEAIDFSGRMAGKCRIVEGRFAGEPGRQRTALSCRYSGASSHLLWTLPAGTTGPFRLRRTGDLQSPNAPAEVWSEGQLLGRFPLVAADPARQWFDHEIDILLPEGVEEVRLEIRPQPDPRAGAYDYSESGYSLRPSAPAALPAEGFELRDFPEVPVER